MRLRTRILIAAAIVLVAGAGYLGSRLAKHGYSAREKPWPIEEFLARQARRIATPAGAKEEKNPHPVTPEALAEGRAHWADHCATCHALDGSGNTALGRNLYPKAPDMRQQQTQELSDGELYYIIENGVRFTGMPAWGGEHSAEEIWHLVAFIRRLPTLTAEELKEMEKMAAGEGGPPTQSDAPGAKPHKH